MQQYLHARHSFLKRCERRWQYLHRGRRCIADVQLPIFAASQRADFFHGFVGMSRGGVNEYDWTTANSDKVSCIYADNPAIRPEAFAKLSELALNDVALLNICGSADSLLPRNTLAIENRYQGVARPDHSDDQGRARASPAQ